MALTGSARQGSDVLADRQARLERPAPVGEGKGIHPGRVV
jgi:hypothetical protein